MAFRNTIATKRSRPLLAAVLATLSLGVATPALAASTTQVFNFSFTTTGTGITHDNLPAGQTSFLGQLLVQGGQVIGLQNASYGLRNGTLGINRFGVSWSQVLAGGGITSTYSNTGTPTLSVSGMSWTSATPGQASGALYSYFNVNQFARGLSYTDSSFLAGDSQTDGLLANSVVLTYAGTLSVPEIDRQGLPVAAFVLGVGMLCAVRARRVRFDMSKLKTA